MDLFGQIVIFVTFIISTVAGSCPYSNYYECPDGVSCCPIGTICSGSVCLSAAVVVIPVLIVVGIIVAVVIYIIRRRRAS